MYEIGDRVYIRFNLSSIPNEVGVTQEMEELEGRRVRIVNAVHRPNDISTYSIDIDNGRWSWEDSLFTDLKTMRIEKRNRNGTFNSIYLNEVFNKQNMALK